MPISGLVDFCAQRIPPVERFFFFVALLRGLNCGCSVPHLRVQIGARSELSLRAQVAMERGAPSSLS
jgi:hypothetical protein